MAISRRRNPHDYRALLDSRGDITIGAYARQERRRRIAGILAGLALLGGALWVYFKLQPDPAPGVDDTIHIAVECANPDCGYRGVLETKSHDIEFPQDCPKCGAHSLHKLWVCRNCGHYFRVKPGATDIVCPNCGSPAVGTAEETPPAAPAP